MAIRASTRTVRIALCHLRLLIISLLLLFWPVAVVIPTTSLLGSTATPEDTRPPPHNTPGAIEEAEHAGSEQCQKKEGVAHQVNHHFLYLCFIPSTKASADLPGHDLQ